MKSSVLKIKSHIDASLHDSEVGSLNEEQEKQLRKDLKEEVLLRATERSNIQYEDEDALKQGKV